MRTAMPRKPLIELLSQYIEGRPSVGVEVGVHCGHTSEAILRAFPLCTLYMVDAWAEYPKDHPYRKSGDSCARKTVEQQLAHKREAIVRTSFAPARAKIIHGVSVEEAEGFAEEFFDFIIADDDHTEAGCYATLCAWYPKLKPEGLFLGDDWLHPREVRGAGFGVTAAVRRFAGEQGLKIKVNEKARLWWLVAG